MSAFSDALDDALSKDPAGGAPKKIAKYVIPELEKRDDGSLEDFMAALGDRKVSHAMLARILQKEPLSLDIKKGALRQYRIDHHPEIFDPHYGEADE